MKDLQVPAALYELSWLTDADGAACSAVYYTLKDAIQQLPLLYTMGHVAIYEWQAQKGRLTILEYAPGNGLNNSRGQTYQTPAARWEYQQYAAATVARWLEHWPNPVPNVIGRPLD